MSIIYDALQKTQQNRALLRDKPNRLHWIDIGLLGIIGFLLMMIVVGYYPRVMKHFHKAPLAVAQHAATKLISKASAVIPVKSHAPVVKHAPAPAHPAPTNVKHNVAPHQAATKSVAPQHVAVARPVPRITVSQPVRLSALVPTSARAPVAQAPAVVAQAQAAPVPASRPALADAILTPQQMLPQVSLPAPIVVTAQPTYVAKQSLNALEPFDLPKAPVPITPNVATAGVLSQPSLQKPALVAAVTEYPVNITGDDLDPSKLVLNGVFLSDKEKIALINNRSFRLGDSLAGMKIIAIDTDSIRLLSSDNKVILLRIVA